jgi:putative transposase
MKYNPDIHHRRSIRLKNYDYSRAGMYFVTICVNHRLPLFGRIFNGEMELNEAGIIVKNMWLDLMNHLSNLALHEFVVMPNHFHGIVEIEHSVGAGLVPALNTRNCANEGQPQGIAPTLGEIVGTFKSLTTNEYIRNVRQNHWQPFEQKLWQRNYHEHIIRNEADYLRIANYVETNPLCWQKDCYFS